MSELALNIEEDIEIDDLIDLEVDDKEEKEDKNYQVYSFNYYGPHEELDNISQVCNNLYNQSLYYMHMYYREWGMVPGYQDLDALMKITPNLEGVMNYKLIKAQCAQQIIRMVSKNYSSFWKSIRAYNKNPKKFKGHPDVPRYKEKNGYSNIYYTNQCSSIRNGKIILSKTLQIDIPEYPGRTFEDFRQIELKPYKNYWKVMIKYVLPINDLNLNKDNFISIDPGATNLITIISSLGDEIPIVVAGGPMRSANQLYNKKKAKLISIKDKMKIPYQTKALFKLEEKRKNRINDYFHKLSKAIISYCIFKNIGTIVVGKNKSWKDSINLGTQTNQTFVNIPHARFIDFLVYKAKNVGITVILHEESFTSKIDHLALEPMCHHGTYLGNRKHRGLFVSSIGKAIHSDVGGAIGILRKVIDESRFIEIVNRGLWFNPKKIRFEVAHTLL